MSQTPTGETADEPSYFTSEIEEETYLQALLQSEVVSVYIGSANKWERGAMPPTLSISIDSNTPDEGGSVVLLSKNVVELIDEAVADNCPDDPGIGPIDRLLFKLQAACREWEAEEGLPHADEHTG